MHRRGSSAASHDTGYSGFQLDSRGGGGARGSKLAFVWALMRRRGCFLVLLALVLASALTMLVVTSPDQLTLPQWLPSSSLSAEQLELPTIAILRPPPELEQDLATCVEHCAGRPAPLSTALGNYGAAPQLSDEQLSHAIVESYGPELDYADSYPKDWPFVMRQTDQFAQQTILELRLTVIAQARPTPTDEADFLFLALDTRAVARCLASCPHRDAFPPTLDRSELKTRVREWLLDTVHWERGRRPYPSLLLSLALIDHDYEGTILSEQAQEVLKDEVVVLGIERAPWETEDKLHWFEQMPYPSTLHLPLRRAPLQPRLSELGAWQLKQERRYLLSFAGKHEPNSPNSGKGPHNGFARRQHLTHTLLAYKETSPSLLSLHFFTPRSSRAELASVHLAMAHSTFCLEPPGDSPTRKGFFDALLLGCIPVIFRRGTYDRVWKGQVELEELAVVSEEKELLEGVGGDVVQKLQGVGEDEIQRKREAIAMVAERVQYGVPSRARELRQLGVEWTDDAVGMLLRQLVLVQEGTRG